MSDLSLRAPDFGPRPCRTSLATEKEARSLESAACSQSSGVFRTHAELIQKPVIVAPLRFELDPEVQEDLGVEEPFELFACGGADALDEVAAAANDDRLLRFPLHQDGAVQPQEPAVADLLEAIDQNSRRKR